MFLKITLINKKRNELNKIFLKVENMHIISSRMSNQVPSLIRIPRKAFEKKVSNSLNSILGRFTYRNDMLFLMEF